METHEDGGNGGVKALAGDLVALRVELRKRMAGAIRAGKACAALGEAGAVDKLAALEQHLGVLRDADLTAFGLEERRAELVSRLTAHRERLKARTRSALLGELSRNGQGVEVALLAESPLTVLVAPLTVEIDLEAGVARMLYAREQVDECEPDAAAILAGRLRAIEHIKRQAVDSAAFFDLAHRAYQTVLLARGLQPGERVDLVDLLGPLSLLAREVGEWRRGGRGGKGGKEGKGLAPYPRYLLAYQLHRLQRDGLLAKDGLRLDLGAATAGSTKNKRDVLFIQSSPTEGQFYLSVRFAPR